MTFLGLIYSLYLVANLLWCALYYRVVQRARKASLRQQAKLQQNGQTDGQKGRPASIVMGDRSDADRFVTLLTRHVRTW